MSVFFTADSHFGHSNIIKYCDRPFLMKEDREAYEANGNSWHRGDWKGAGSSSWRISRDAVDMMNDHLTDHINAIVGTDDTLWHLGDWAFAGKNNYEHKCKFYRDRIRCKNINIIWGNHDQPRKIRDLFSESYDFKEIRVGDQNIVLCHYAMAVWNKSHRGAWQLYGHSHSGAEPWADKFMEGRRSIDVGVDNAKKIIGEYRPFRFEELRDIFSKREGFSMDHHAPRNSTAPTEEQLLG